MPPKPKKSKSKAKSIALPVPEPVPDASSSSNSDSDSDSDSQTSGSDSGSVFDSGSESDNEFEDQGSDSDDDSLPPPPVDSGESDDDSLQVIESHYTGATSTSASAQAPASSSSSSLNININQSKLPQYDPTHVRITSLNRELEVTQRPNAQKVAVETLHIDDLSSDDSDGEGTGNRTGKVPLHWYDEFDHVGYTVDGGKKKRGISGKDGEGGEDALDRAIKGSDGKNRWTVTLHIDDLSSDDSDGEGTGNRTGKVPLHWYDEFDHVGYTVDGGKKKRGISGKDGEGGEDALDRAIKGSDGKNRWTVRDEVNDVDVELTLEQRELIRRIQSGAFAHSAHDANPDYISYFSGVDLQISGLSSTQPSKESFLPESKYSKLKVRFFEISY